MAVDLTRVALEPPGGRSVRSVYREPMLWLLMLIQTFGYLDRQVINILAEPIKRDLDLSDVQIGMMTGLAFALFYAVLGIPIARYCDRPSTDRVGVISICLALWSLMTALCGMALSFVQILAARVGVGVGEAGCAPPAHSLLSDLFKPAERPAALAFYGLGLPLGMIVGLAAGGILAESIGWRWALIIFGGPGLLLAGLFWVIGSEPRRDVPTSAASAQEGSLSLFATLRVIAGMPAMLYLAAAITSSVFLVYGKGTWQAIFLIRSHGLSVGQVGLTLGAVVGLGLAIGTWLGGEMAQRYGRNNRRHLLTPPVVGLLASIPLYIAAYLVTDWRVAALFLFGATISSGVLYGPTYSCLQGLAEPSMRAAAVALVMLFQNLLGLGLGPVLFGWGSDLLMPSTGIESVRWVLILTTLLTPIPAYFYWRASKLLDQSLRD